MLSRALASLLYGVKVAAAGLLTVAAQTASFLPARRAATADPVVTLRHE